MKEIITYTLRENNKTSDIYYNEVTQFAEETKSNILGRMGKILEVYLNYIKQNQIEESRTIEEYAIEALMIGVFLLVYKDRAMNLNKYVQKFFVYLAYQREKGKYQKVVSDFIKGRLAVFMLPKEKAVKMENMYLMEQFSRLMEWLEASGDFKQEVIRLRAWSGFLHDKSAKESQSILEACIEAARWFDKRSVQKMGKYTVHIEDYVSKSYELHKGKEDIIFCSRKRLEYHLNMVGAEIMNQALRESFLKQKSKIVFLPRCMCQKSKNTCQAGYTPEGYICRHCEKTCPISQIAKLERIHDFKVYIIPHESDFKHGDAEKNKQTGIVGVACVLNLLSGGFKAEQMGFVPQCVLLDYCGCRNHWHRTGIVTEINIARLKQILGIHKPTENHKQQTVSLKMQKE